MAVEMVANPAQDTFQTPPGSVFAQDDLFHARARICEAIALQRMISLIEGANSDDFDTVQGACAVTLRLLEEASKLLSGEE